MLNLHIALLYLSSADECIEAQGDGHNDGQNHNGFGLILAGATSFGKEMGLVFTLLVFMVVKSAVT